MKIGSTLIKGAICGALLFGNVVVPEDGYLEDDSDFQKVTTFLSSGWGWFQVSTANAACTIADTSDCVYETIRIPPGDPEPYPSPPPPPIPEPPPQEDDGGGGGGGSPPPPSDPPPPQPSAECTINANSMVIGCKSLYNWYGGGVASLFCPIMGAIVNVYAPGIVTIVTSSCVSATAAVTFDAHAWCDAQGVLLRARNCE